MDYSCCPVTTLYFFCFVRNVMFAETLIVRLSNEVGNVHWHFINLSRVVHCAAY
jgi:hypothetical protein